VLLAADNEALLHWFPHGVRLPPARLPHGQERRELQVWRGSDDRDPYSGHSLGDVGRIAT
jgi:hypothetical protein